LLGLLGNSVLKARLVAHRKLAFGERDWVFERVRQARDVGEDGGYAADGLTNVWDWPTEVRLIVEIGAELGCGVVGGLGWCSGVRRPWDVEYVKGASVRGAGEQGAGWVEGQRENRGEIETSPELYYLCLGLGGPDLDRDSLYSQVSFSGRPRMTDEISPFLKPWQVAARPSSARWP
jgi:hypothetical protein